MKPFWMRKLVKSLFGSSKKNSLRPAQSRSIEIEQLENRITPTTITNIGGLISILGSNGPLLPDDNLTISIANNQLTVTEANTTLTGTVFGVTAANNTVTIDFATNAAAKALTGISINLQDGNDTLNVITGLDFRSLPINNNAVSILFDGDGLGSPAGNNIFTFQGITASKTSTVTINNFGSLVNTDATGNLAIIQASGGNFSLSKNGAMTVSSTAVGSAGVAFESSVNGNTIAINNQLVVNTPLFIRGVGAADKIAINSITTTGTSFSGSALGSLSFRTQGDISIQGAVTLKNSFTVLDSENFTAQQNVSATSISMTNNTNLSTTVIAFNRNVTTTAGNFLITNLGSKTNVGAQFYINRDAITTGSAGLVFSVAGNLTAGTTGGLYDLFIAGQTATVGTNITISNKGSLTLGTLNIPAVAPPNASITSVAGFFDASAITGPTNLFMDVISSQYVTINGDVLVRAANSGTTNRNFTIQAQNGDINIVGQIQLLDNAGNTSFGSDLTLWAGVAPNIDLGSINIQSVIGSNRSLIINDCKNFTSTSSIQVKSLVLQATGGDANQGAGQYVFSGNIGLLNSPTAITANSGGYNIQILGTANVFGSPPPAALSDFNNTGTVVLGNNSSSTINFTGGAIFHENTIVSGVGIVSGNTRIQGNLTPGGVQTNGVGILTFTSSLTLEETNPLLPPDLRKAVYYPEILGNIPGSTQDQTVLQSGFVLSNNPILYPILRSSTVVVGNQFTIVRQTDSSPVAGKFTGLVNLASNTYSVLNEGDTFFASGGQFRISYTGGDGNDVVITFLGYASGTSVFVDANNVLNVLGDNKASNVTVQVQDNGTVDSVSLNLPGTGYNVSPTVTFTGTPTVPATATSSLSINQLSVRITTAIGTGTGTGYAVGNQIQILGGNVNAIATVNTVNGAGGILTLTITNPVTNNGYNPTSLNGLSIQAITGAGVGGTVNAVTSIFSPVSAGTGYVAGQNVTILQGTNRTATATVTSVNGTGGITGLLLTNNGSGYTDLTNLIVTGSVTANNAIISGFGSLSSLTLLTSGSGYTGTPLVNITSVNGLGSGATGSATLTTVLNIRDLVFGLTGFAYGSKVVNNTIDIAITKPTVIGPNQFTGLQVTQNGGSDTLNLTNVNLVAINALNPNVANVFFSLNGGPTSTPNQDIDILNINGLNQNVETGVSGTSTVLIQGYDFIHSQGAGGVASTGVLNSANQTGNSLKILGAVSYDIGDITFGSNNRADTTTPNGKSIALVPSTAGTITLANDGYLGDGAKLTLGNGSASNLVLQSIAGTQGGVSSSLTFNVARFNSVQNGTINTTPINITGGSIGVNGSIGTDIGNFLIQNSGITNFNKTVDASAININENDGGITFKGAVGSFAPTGSEPLVTIGSISLGAFITFQDNLTASSINSTGTNLNYGLQLLGSSTKVINNTNLLNIGGIVLGDSIDTLSFLGGLNVDFNSPVQISGIVQSQGAPISIASNTIINGNVEIGITLNANTIIKTTLGPAGTSAPIILGRVFSNANSLTLDAGNKSGSTISIDELRGDAGSLIIVNSAGATISQVGKISTAGNNFSNENFGVISILDSINDIVFDGPVLAEKILTFEKSYNVSFIGSTSATITNDQRIFIITNPDPTVFRNRGNVTFGVNGSDPNGLMDLFIFNGGVDTSPITGTTNLAARIYTNNTNIIFDDISISNSTFLNTYLSSVALSDFLDLGFTITFPNLTSNILSIFGYPNSSRFAIRAGNEVLPFSTGSIILSSVVNNGFTFSLNAGGPGASSSLVTGNISMASYTGNFNEIMRIYRGNDVTVFGAVSGYDIFIGTIANGSLSSLVELTGTVSIQGDFTITDNFQVSSDVNNVAITGNVNTISGQININNIGFLQLGNSSTDLFTVSTNLNVRGPAERRVAGLFNLTGSRTLDFGPGITSLVANTVVTTNSQVGTTIGQVNNNAFNLTINGRTQIQRYANDSELSPYPSPTNPSSIIPVNNILGAGTGGGNVILNGEVSVQNIIQSSLSSILVTDGGTGYTSAPSVVITGGGGSGATATAILGIAAITRIFPGTGYVVNDAVNLSDFFGNSSATAVVTTVDAQGGITALNLTSAGSGYTFVNFLTVTGGTGTGASVRAAANVVSVTITNQGSGYSSPPVISFVNNNPFNVGTGAAAVANITVTNGFPPGNIINLPPDISLRKQGTGSVFLNTDSSANTVGLFTTIENGNFFFQNAKINAATITNVAGNGLLGGTKGTLGAVNVLPQGVLSPGDLTTAIGVLNLQGNLSVQSTYKVDIRSVAFNLFDQVNVTGSVSLAKNNVNGILDVRFTPDANVAIGNAFGIISNDGSDAVIGNFITTLGRPLTQNSTFTVPLPDGVNVATFQISYTGNIAVNGTASLTGGNDVVIQITNIQSINSTVAAKSQNPNKLFAVSTDSGGGPVVKINFADGTGFSFFAYDTSFTGGVRTAIGDVNGDGNPDLITAAGPGGGPHVVIWTITPGVPYATVQSGFFAFEPGFTGGITLATGNINGDVSSSGNALDDIIVGAGAGGGPRVKAFAGNATFAAINNQSQLVDFFAYAPEFNLGVNVAAGDRTGDGNDEIITGAAQGGGPHVQVWQIANNTATSIQSFFAFDPTYLCGVFVGAGDLDGDNLADIYTGTGSGPTGAVSIFYGSGATSRLEPFGPAFTGGIRVGAALGAFNNLTNTYPPYLLVAAGPGGGPQVSLFDSNLNIVDAFFAFPENFTGGVLASTTVNT
ncbi:MAG: beta strand repeat-containing protein [Gemmataceae bacterium]